MENKSVFELDEALKVAAVFPVDSGIEVNDMETFDLEEALAVPIQPQAADGSDGEDADHIVKVEQGVHEPPELRTMRIGDSDVIFYEADQPSEQVEEDSQSSNGEDLVDPSCFDFVEIDSSDLDEEPQCLKPVAATVPSMFSSFRNAQNTEDSSMAVEPLNTDVVADIVKSRNDSQNDITDSNRSSAPSIDFEVSELTELDAKAEMTVESSSDAASLQAPNVAFTYSQPVGNETFLPGCPTSAEVLTPAQVVAASGTC